MLSEKYVNNGINDFFSWVEKNVSENSLLHKAVASYLAESVGDTDFDGDGPFLSVVMRTQGKRPHMLEEVLLCLVGQSNPDFELLIMGHNLSAEQERTVSDIISDQPELLREKTRLIRVDGGTRTTPLNRGFEAARGKYIAVLDDDDIVFENWVEAFYELHEKEDGKILHTFSVEQDWETLGGELEDTPRAVGAPQDHYCRDFKFFDSLAINSNPLCALAFPSYAFKRLGIRFDESFTTNEDWDYLMRCAFFTGVANSSELTFIYRKWVNAENSKTLHAREEWNANLKRIVESFINSPIIMPRGALEGVIDKYVDVPSGKLNACLATVADEGEIYCDTGTGFSSDKILHATLKTGSDGETVAVFSNDAQITEGVECIRFDPCHAGFITLSDLKIELAEPNGTVSIFGLEDVGTNGYKTNEGAVAFVYSDPQITVDLGHKREIAELRVTCYFERTVKDRDIRAATASGASIVRRGARKLKRIAKRLLGR